MPQLLIDAIKYDLLIKFPEGADMAGGGLGKLDLERHIQFTECPKWLAGFSIRTSWLVSNAASFCQTWLTGQHAADFDVAVRHGAVADARRRNWTMNLASLAVQLDVANFLEGAAVGFDPGLNLGRLL